MRKRLARLYPKFPPNTGWVVAIIVTLHLVPFAIIAVYRTTTHSQPPIHVVLDMDVQPKLKPQAYVGPGNAQMDGALFADGRAMRPQIPGTVARGALIEDDVLRQGYTEDAVSIEARDGQRVRTVDWRRSTLDTEPWGDRFVEDETVPDGEERVTQRGILGYTILRERTIQDAAGVHLEERRIRYPPTDRIIRVAPGYGLLPLPDNPY